MKALGRLRSRRRTAIALSSALVVAAMVVAAQVASTPTAHVMVSADFDSLPTGRISPENFMKTLGGTNTSPTPYDDTSIVEVPGKGKVIRTTFVAGTMKSIPSGNNGSSLFLPLSKVVDQACMSYDIRFDGNFDWSLGGKLPGLEGVAPEVSPGYPTGGTTPGRQGWSARIMWLTPKSYGWAGPVNEVVSYMYTPTQTTRYGENVRWHERFSANKWHTVKQCFTMNTVGRADGKLHAWLDGVQVLSEDAYIFRMRRRRHQPHRVAPLPRRQHRQLGRLTHELCRHRQRADHQHNRRRGTKPWRAHRPGSSTNGHVVIQASIRAERRLAAHRHSV